MAGVMTEAPLRAPPKPMREVAADFRAVFQCVDPYNGEREGFCEVTQGEIPAALTGTLLRNGPSLWERAGERKQFLDGDGMVSTLAFKDGKAYFRNKFVRTDSFVREQEAGKWLDMSIFTPKDPREGSAFVNRLWGDMLNGPPSPKDNAAYNVVHWAGSLCAVSYKQPWLLDDRTLDTIGHAKDKFSSLQFTAHFRPIKEPDSDDVYMVTMDPKIDWAKGTSTYTFREVDTEGNVVRVGGPWVFEAGYNHDMCVTDNWYILYDSPVKMDFKKVLIDYPLERESLGGTTVSDFDTPPRFRLFPRRGQNGGKYLEVKASRHTYAYHHINAFEDEDGIVHFDSCIFDDYDLYFEATVETDGERAYPTSKFCRFSIDPSTQQCTDRVLDETPFEFPMVNERFHGKPYQHSFQVAVAYQDADGHYGPLQSMMKLSMDSTSGKDAAKASVDWWHPGAGKFCHEPAVVCKPDAVDEDDVWVISVVFDSETSTSEVIILDGKDYSAGPVATVALPVLVPYGVHGGWTNSHICGPPEESA